MENAVLSKFDMGSFARSDEILKRIEINTLDKDGIDSFNVFIQEMTSWQLKILFILNRIEYSLLEN